MSSGRLSAVNRPAVDQIGRLARDARRSPPCACAHAGRTTARSIPRAPRQATQAIALTRALPGPTMLRFGPGMDTVSRLPSIYFEKLLENSPDIVVAVDRKGDIIFYNDGARQMLGYSPDEVLGQHVTRLYPDLDEARKVMQAMRDGGADAGTGRTSRPSSSTKSGERIPVAISGSHHPRRRRRRAGLDRLRQGPARDPPPRPPGDARRGRGRRRARDQQPARGDRQQPEPARAVHRARQHATRTSSSRASASTRRTAAVGAHPADRRPAARPARRAPSTRRASTCPAPR